MRKVKYGVLIVALLAVVPLPGMAAGAPQITQPAAVDPELQKLADDYAAAWAKGDAVAIAALCTTDAIYIDSQNRLMMGRSEIEAGFKERFEGTLKGSTITLRLGQTRQLAPDVRIGEGTWQISGIAPGTAASPAGASAVRTAGRYLNTLVRQQGRWMIASTAAVPEVPPSPVTRNSSR